VRRADLARTRIQHRALSGIGEQGIAHTLSGRLFAGALGEDTTLTATPPIAVDYAPALAKIDAQTQNIVKLIDEQNKARKLALIIAGASALFAAVKLGVIAFPHIKARVTGG
jgi:hypothetical protein